jgi:hypothetical protein
LRGWLDSGRFLSSLELLTGVREAHYTLCVGAAQREFVIRHHRAREELR